jgi:hypothetical protein
MNPRSLPYVLLVLVFVLMCVPAFGQKKAKKSSKPALDTTTIYHDIFRGVLPDGHDSIITLLQLDHKLYHDEGTFNLDESYKKTGGRLPSVKSQGFWTVLKGDADDDDATVVEVDGEDYQQFFLRRNDSTLQKIDATLHIIEPAEAYLMRRIAGKPVIIKKAALPENDKTMHKLAGTYKGKLHCADCSSISSTLLLQYRGNSKMGTYVLTDKYIGTKTGDIVHEKKGRWSYVSKLIEADHKTNIIVLDSDKRGKELWYYVKKDGNIVQLDKSQQEIKAPFDQTLKKQ